MDIYEITFSPTGGTEKVSNLITKAFNRKTTSIDLTDSKLDFHAFRFTEEDICVAAVPSYGGRAPGIAISRLKKMTGGGAKAILVAVYGNRAYEDTLLELQDTLTDRGFQCVAGIAAVAEHSIMHQFAAGRPDAQDRRELTALAEEIRRRIEAGDLPERLELPGNRPYREFSGLPLKPKAGRECTNCGLCAKQCPVSAISSDHPGRVDKEKCISCMRCISVCPSKARSVNKLLVTAAGMKMKKNCSTRKNCEVYM